MMIDDDKPNLAWPTLVMFLIVTGAATLLFWIPLFLYAWHWWMT